MMHELTIVVALRELGYTDGYAASEAAGILLWNHDTPQPTETELVDAGWVKHFPDPPVG